MQKLCPIVIIKQRRNLDDSASIGSAVTSAKFGRRRFKLKNEKLAECIDKNIAWIQLNLSHHVINRRSICFVLDNQFKHYKQH